MNSLLIGIIIFLGICAVPSIIFLTIRDYIKTQKKTDKMRKVKKHTVLTTSLFITAILLLIGIFPWEISYDILNDYYDYLRLSILITTIILITSTYNLRKQQLLVLGVITFLFNPFIPLEMAKEVWILLDISTALYLGYLGIEILEETKTIK